MNYFIIVNKIKSNHESGIYGRKKLSKQESTDIQESSLLSSISDYSVNDVDDVGEDFGFFTKTLSNLKSIQASGTELLNKAMENISETISHKELVLQEKIHDKRVLIFKDNLLENNYSISATEENFFYGFFDSQLLKKNAFQKIMKSFGGATLTIVERDSINKKHFGGEEGKFSYGIYCEHPKNNEILIPLNNSSEIIKNMILEEIISCYESLGAKKIIIHDISEYNVDADANFSKFSFSTDHNRTETVIREKEFGKGTFDPLRAKSNKHFIYDFPNVITTINARIHGNQILDKFSEIIDLTAGVEADILNIYGGKINYNYKRKWHFEVHFYDKTDF